MNTLESYFEQFRKNIVGIDTTYISPNGVQKIMYADWIGSGRLYAPIERKILEQFGPYIANTHTETSETGTLMTHSYHYAQKLIKQHVNASPNDVIVQAGFGMTAVINKLQRILGLKGCGMLKHKECLRETDRPIVFITHMEHHSNQTSWYETAAEVVIIEPDENLLVSPENLRKELEKYKDRKLKIGSFSAASNVTGVKPPYHKLAKIMHEYGGVCFVDFAASAPYAEINMHPEDPMEKLDAIFFSPHKFLGGPGTAGILIFDSSLYNSQAPDNPGGGTVDWTNRWGEYKYIDNIELREDGGTPGFLQAIRTALVFELKDQMGVQNIENREKELIPRAFNGLRLIPGVRILADNVIDRIGALSFYIENVHYNLVVKILSDRYGIQVRGGCACAGTYGHYLLDVSYNYSHEITQLINHGDLSQKPGWVRWSIHPTTLNSEIDYFVNAIEEIAKNHKKWAESYEYHKNTNEFTHRSMIGKSNYDLKKWFSL
ncbi:MAG: selenocysteine lyase [Bacteroidetes bacterium GWF2_33_16]|nr:MAG: selenocysteine lyase [Bacteroidetes bacterium GWE2_32_14]OFY05223.1 MAG: selenocysteine lyase [Bacteroidetes bacterium GWF2_33_16]